MSTKCQHHEHDETSGDSYNLVIQTAFSSFCYIGMGDHFSLLSKQPYTERRKSALRLASETSLGSYLGHACMENDEYKDLKIVDCVLELIDAVYN